jgi:ribA/ribD-fused uncharacterized protein
MINVFKQTYSWLSNFYLSPVKYEGFWFPCSENAYQAKKSSHLSNEEIARYIGTENISLNTKNLGYCYFSRIKPAEAKKMGRIIPVRPDWETIKVDVMKDIVRLKFTQSSELRKFLLATGDEELVEGNTWHDNFWGDCSCNNCRSIKGTNMLGKILMEVREELKN